MPTLSWTDIDGDVCEVAHFDTRLGAENGIAVVHITDAEDGRDAGVYIDEKDARRLIAWLTERLGQL
jgi:hypothetical protein